MKSDIHDEKVAKELDRLIDDAKNTLFLTKRMLGDRSLADELDNFNPAAKLVDLYEKAKKLGYDIYSCGFEGEIVAAKYFIASIESKLKGGAGTVLEYMKRDLGKLKASAPKTMHNEGHICMADLDKIYAKLEELVPEVDSTPVRPVQGENGTYSVEAFAGVEPDESETLEVPSSSDYRAISEEAMTQESADQWLIAMEKSLESDLPEERKIEINVTARSYTFDQLAKNRRKCKDGVGKWVNA